MERTELIEWILIIAVIVAWWPYLFLGFNAPWYHALVFYLSPVVLAVILVRRYRRMQEGFEYSRKIVDAQHRATGANVLGQKQQGPGRGPQSAYPGVALPDDVDAVLEEQDEGEEGDARPGTPDMQNMPDIPGISGRRPDEGKGDEQDHEQ